MRMIRKESNQTMSHYPLWSKEIPKLGACVQVIAVPRARRPVGAHERCVCQSRSANSGHSWRHTGACEQKGIDPGGAIPAAGQPMLASIPQLAEANTPRRMDADGGCSSYDGFKAGSLA